MSNNSRFPRPTGTRPYKKLFLLSVEGAKTEENYFRFFNSLGLPISVKVLKRQTSKSSPKQVLKEMMKYIGKGSQELKKQDEAWIVIDRNGWPEDQIQKILDWEKKKEKHNVAIRNPNFEYWLLLHFEGGNRVQNPKDCLARLREHLPDYQKNVDMSKITRESFATAIQRAKVRHKNKVETGSKICSTNVHILVERILSS